MSVPPEPQTFTPPPSSPVDTMDTSTVADIMTLPERFPAEVFDRIIKHLGNQPKPDDRDHDHDKSTPESKSKYPALAALQQTSRAMYLRATPYMYNTYECDLLGFTMLLEQFDPITVEEVEDAIYRPDREGHPIEWTYATRLLWMMSHLERFIYRPRIEWTFWSCQTDLATRQVVLLKLHLDSLGADLLLAPSLSRLVFDTSQYEGEYSKLVSTRLLGKGRYSELYSNPDDKVKSDWHYKERGCRVLSVHSMADKPNPRHLERGLATLVSSKLSICLRGSRDNSYVYQLANTHPEIGMPSDTIILHDFARHQHRRIHGSDTFFNTQNVIWSSFSQYLRINDRGNHVNFIAGISGPGVKRILGRRPQTASRRVQRDSGRSFCRTLGDR